MSSVTNNPSSNTVSTITTGFNNLSINQETNLTKVQAPLLTPQQEAIKKVALEAIAAGQEIEALPLDIQSITAAYILPEEYIKEFIKFTPTSKEFEAFTQGIDLVTIDAALAAFDGTLADEDLRNIVKNVSEETRLNMQSIRLYTTCTDADLHYLSLHFPNLQTLNLYDCKNITDTGLIHLSSFKQLRSLNLVNCTQITNAGLAYIARLTKLTYLNLKYCKEITDAGLAHIPQLTELESLNLRWCYKITDSGFAHLKTLKKLKHLDLHYCELISDQGLAHLKELTNLEYLDLFGCRKITLKGIIDHLKKLTNLKYFDGDYRFCVSVDEIADLKKIFPNLEIRR